MSEETRAEAERIAYRIIWKEPQKATAIIHEIIAARAAAESKYREALDNGTEIANKLIAAESKLANLKEDLAAVEANYRRAKSEVDGYASKLAKAVGERETVEWNYQTALDAWEKEIELRQSAEARAAKAEAERNGLLASRAQYRAKIETETLERAAKLCDDMAAQYAEDAKVCILNREAWETLRDGIDAAVRTFEHASGFANVGDSEEAVEESKPAIVNDAYAMWTCERCGFANELRDLRCVKCNHLHPDRGIEMGEVKGES